MALRVVLRVASMNDDGPTELARERELGCECGALLVARRVVVVIVETTFADGDGTPGDLATDAVDIATRFEVERVVRMHARSVIAEVRVRRGEVAGACGRSE